MKVFRSIWTLAVLIVSALTGRFVVDCLLVFTCYNLHLHSRLLERSARVSEKYGNGSLTALPIAAVLWAVQNGYMDDVAVDKVRDFQNKLTDYLNNRKAELLARIAVYQLCFGLDPRRDPLPPSRPFTFLPMT